MDESAAAGKSVDASAKAA